MKSMVIVPTYNERDNIEKLVSLIIGLNDGFHITIVDDNSPDGTGKIADDLAKIYQEVHVIHRRKKAGIGPAYIEGFKYALSNGVDYIFQMDADLSHDPMELPQFKEGLKTHDLVLGTRYRGGVRVLNWSFKRLLISKFASHYVKRITKLPVSDATSGFKAFRRQVLETIDLDKIKSDGYSFQIETTYKAFRKGFKIKDIPIIFFERANGSSKMTLGIIWEAIWAVWRLILKR